MTQIIPAILATTEEEYQKKIHQIEDSGLFKDSWVQIDLMDNKFVQNKSVGPNVIVKYPINSKLEAHLMVEYPENWIDELVKTNIDRIIFPVEDSEGVEERIQHIKNHGKQVGLSINPETPEKKLEPFIGLVDLILVMSVHPGFQGQEFIIEVLEKASEIKKLNPNMVVEIDGGVNQDNVRQILDAGVDNLVIGSGLFEYDNLEEGLEKIWEKIRG